MLASSSLVICLLVVSASSFPQLPPGVDPVSCPNYPFCGEVPVGSPAAAPAQPAAVPGLAAHAAAERAVIGRQQQFANGGVVGASGNIGPSGLCGPSGCIAFRR